MGEPYLPGKVPFQHEINVASDDAQTPKVKEGEGKRETPKEDFSRPMDKVTSGLVCKRGQPGLAGKKNLDFNRLPRL